MSADLESARALVGLCEAGVADAEATAKASGDEVAAREIALAKAREDGERAARAFTADETSAKASEVTRARLVIDRVGRELEAAKGRHQEASQSLHSAREALDRARRDVRIGELEIEASLTAAREVAAPHAATFAAVVVQARDSLQALLSIRDASNQAAAELAKLTGEHVPPLDEVHVLVQVCELLAEGAGAVFDERTITQVLRHLFQGPSRPISALVVQALASLLDVLERSASMPHYAKETSRTLLEAAASTRTYAESVAARAERDRVRFAVVGPAEPHPLHSPGGHDRIVGPKIGRVTPQPSGQPDPYGGATVARPPRAAAKRGDDGPDFGVGRGWTSK